MPEPRWFASDLAAEGPPRNDPRLVVSSIELRGAVHVRGESSQGTEEPVGGDEMGDLLAGDRRRDHPGRGRPKVDRGCVHDHRDPAHREGRRAGGTGSGAGPAGEGTGLAARGGPRRDRGVDRGDQGPGDRAGGDPGKVRLGLSGPLPARVPAEVKELVLKIVDDAVADGFAHGWACSLWQVAA